jgi:hypothetical protein
MSDTDVDTKQVSSGLLGAYKENISPVLLMNNQNHLHKYQAGWIQSAILKLNYACTVIVSL